MTTEPSVISMPTSITDLPEALAQLAGWNECVAALHEGKQAAFDSVWGSSCALLVAGLARAGIKSILVVFPHDKAIEATAEDLLTFTASLFEKDDSTTQSIAVFPACPDLGPAELATDDQYGQRLRLLRDLNDGNLPRVICTSIAGLLQSVPARQAFSQNAKRLKLGERLDVGELREWLKDSNFQITHAVELPGEFSIRGGIIDVYPPDALQPFRIELFDDTIESIRIFEVATQRSIQKIHELEISRLATVVPKQERSASVKTDEFLHVGDERTRLQGEWSSLFEYLPSNTAVVLVELAEIYDQVRHLEQTPAHTFPRIPFSELQATWGKFGVASVSRLAFGQFHPQCTMPVETLGPFSGVLDEVRFELERLSLDQRVFLVTNSDAESHRVGEILKQTQAAMSGRLSLSQGYIHEGFRLKHVKSIALGCDQLFQRSDLRRTWRGRTGRTMESAAELKSGDLVVHLTHGIGRYRGLKLLEHNASDGPAYLELPSIERHSEHLEIEFADKVKIYVPVNKIGLIQKYVGATKKNPKLAKIGGKTGGKQKQDAEQTVNDLAADMLEMQAKRAAKPGIQFSADTEWQIEFEHSFPYRETADQLTAVDAIKGDMMSDKPMDRLLCGDVGFGKTEVAMRAAFKAVESGYQVAVLVPTTVLAEQHFKTFKERMVEYPVTIERLSRFASNSEQRSTVERLKAGSVDIIIGTHRLVSKDVSFNNLGLIIIDEEQRFGVGVKERLKQFRLEVDVLTMSATPIPRTLHMSLVGVRDISNLTIPPEDRMPIETRLSPFDEQLIREGMTRELNRGGQIFFVHNRIQDIQVVKQKLISICPEARIVVGHGQMDEGDLEQAMTEFVEGKYDILLATTIIENGLDIPNANTIFINHANRMGLSELHQLRGRVGRYKHRAYCYILIDSRANLTPTAAKRLQAIQHYSHMGAGFQIAMRDLEIRGAGNLLGVEQSGHISHIGYEMYCQLLDAAVRRLKKMPARLVIDVDFDLPVEAFIPDDFVPNRNQKVDLYRRIYGVESFELLIELKREIRDRFGPIPLPVKRLIKLAEIKLEAAIWQISAIFISEKRYLGLRFKDKSRMSQLVNRGTLPIRATDEGVAYLTLNRDVFTQDNLLKLLQSILRAK